jgi:hypothetical protein
MRQTFFLELLKERGSLDGTFYLCGSGHSFFRTVLACSGREDEECFTIRCVAHNLMIVETSRESNMNSTHVSNMKTRNSHM